MTKNYKLVDGKCINCALYRECKGNEEGVKAFLAAIKINCIEGKTVKVVESEII